MPTRRNSPNSPSSPTAGGTRKANSGRCTKSIRCASTGSTALRRLPGKRVLDVGCGGGILADSMARRGRRGARHRPGRQGAQGGAAACARSRRRAASKYREVSVEALAAEQPGSFDVVTCMEMLEHVPDPASVVQACAQLVKPGGWVFFSTINRNPKSFLLRHRRRRVRAGHAAARHARVPEADPARASWPRIAGPPVSTCATRAAWSTTR